MAQTVFEYEVELAVTNPNTKERRLITRREHAYSIGDALLQAGLNANVGAQTVTVMRVGPPVDAILAAQAPDWSGRAKWMMETERFLRQLEQRKRSGASDDVRTKEEDQSHADTDAPHQDEDGRDDRDATD